MRTTIELPADGHRRMRVFAAMLGVSMGDAVDIAVTESLQQRGMLDRLTTGDDPVLTRGDGTARRRSGGNGRRKAV